MIMNAHHRCVLLDRDGVINRHIPNGYVTSWEQFEFLPGALEALWLLAQNDYTALVISNQACVGKGLLSFRQLHVITRRFCEEVALAGGNIARVYYCPHTEEDRCSCRKPSPGLIERARDDYRFAPEETFVIGDSLSDVQAAAAAGCSAICIRRTGFADVPEPDHALTAADLREAVQLVIARQKHEVQRTSASRGALVPSIPTGG